MVHKINVDLEGKRIMRERESECAAYYFNRVVADKLTNTADMPV